jgi:hypothetical protein
MWKGAARDEGATAICGQELFGRTDGALVEAGESGWARRGLGSFTDVGRRPASGSLFAGPGLLHLRAQ